MVCMQKLAVTNLSLIFSLMFKDQVQRIIDFLVPSSPLTHFITITCVMCILVAIMQSITVPHHAST